MQIIQGNVLQVLPTLATGSVHCCVTSPPYWGLRDYGCDGQLGLERTYREYIDKMVLVFSEVRRVLRENGTLWLNIGDSYSRGGCGSRDPEKWPKQSRNDHRLVHIKDASGLKPKDLMMIPARLAIALQEDGWYLRSDIIWHKPSPMPESVKDRPTTAHEHIFLLSKSKKYYYDFKAIMEPTSGTAHPRGHGVNPKARVPSGWDTTDSDHHQLTGRYPKTSGANSSMRRDKDPAHQKASDARHKQNRSFSAAVNGLVDFRNKRSVWTIASQPYRGAHFATFPEKLVEPCILAGCPEGGTVFDPFAGSGTVGVVAGRFARNFLGIELNPAYVAMAEKRIGSVMPLLRAVANG